MNENRRAACIIGWPVSHSRSPLIHNYWIKLHGVDAEYRREAVEPARLADFIASLRQHGYVGANVTVPHKEAILELAKPDDRATAVGAANTVWYEGGALHATNTDVEGFLGNLDTATPGWDKGLTTAVVLGAGGAARGVIFGLLSRGVECIHVLNRTVERAEALKQQFGSAINPAEWTEMTGLLGGAGLLVNSTILGMKGQPRLDINLRCQPSMVVADLVYDPLETALVKASRQRGLRVADGLGMLMHQAVGGFERWFGIRPQVTPELRALVEADLMKAESH